MEKYGELTILRHDRHVRNTNGHECYCACSCGNFVTVSYGNLRSGGTKSCGCLRRKRNRENAEKRSKKFFGHSIHELSTMTNVKPITIRKRISRGLPFEKVIETKGV